MIKKLTILILILFTVYCRSVSGQTPSSTASAVPVASSTPAIDKQLQKLKDNLATKAAQLMKQTQEATAGYVTDVVGTGFKLKTTDEKELEIKIDTLLTKFSQISGNLKNEIKSSDIKKGAYLIVSGPRIDKSVTANVIYLDEEFLVFAGKISEVNKDDLSLKVTTSYKDTYTLDIETSTKQQILNSRSLQLESSGFSKIKEGDIVHFVIKKAQKNKEINRYSAVRILLIPQEYFIK